MIDVSGGAYGAYSYLDMYIEQYKNPYSYMRVEITISGL